MRNTRATSFQLNRLAQAARNQAVLWVNESLPLTQNVGRMLYPLPCCPLNYPDRHDYAVFLPTNFPEEPDRKIMSCASQAEKQKVTVDYEKDLYKGHKLIEIKFGNLKQNKRIDTRR